jgi:hypothetical protein
MGQAKQRGAYPTDWRELARLVKDEAGWCCVRCGHAHDRASGYVLTVHHFTGDKSNCARWNCIPLCQRCHLSVQARVNPAVAILTDPAPWAMPYISGLYESGGCAPSPGYDLSRWIREYEATGRRWPAWAIVPARDSELAGKL